MKPTELAHEISIEFEAIQITVEQLVSLHQDTGQNQPTIRDVAAAGLFLANFYNGVENTLKRIYRYYGIELPSGSDSHVKLMQSFCDPPRAGLPRLLDAELAEELAPYRQFRHVVHHGYGFRLTWVDMLAGVEAAPATFSKLRSAVEHFLKGIQSTEEDVSDGERN